MVSALSSVNNLLSSHYMWLFEPMLIYSVTLITKIKTSVNVKRLSLTKTML